MSEFDRTPVPPSGLKPGRYFAAGFAGEHIAGTEFVIGAMFVAWGVGAMDVIKGLALGNLLAVLTWALICTPIATQTRLTLYAYLEKVAGPGFVKIYSVVSGMLFCVLAGAMITVSASAVRIPFGIPAQVNWYPSDARFVLVVIGVGAVVTYAATKGFAFVARFAEVSAPWLVCMFMVGALIMVPVIVADSQSVDAIAGVGDFLALAESSIWIDQQTDMGFWHVAAIAWGANLAFHGALGDMTLLRFARRTWYGWYASLGMFIGHFAAWLAAGIMGAGAALVLSTELAALDPGSVAFQALGPVGILAVIVAGWTTSNPTLYRAGLAFQSLNPGWSRERVTVVVGAITTVIAAFPFVFTGLLSFLGLMALVMAPTGAILVVEHYLLQRLGGVRYWRALKGHPVNLPAVAAWIAGVGVAAALHLSVQMHILFLFLPAWITAFIVYPALALRMGAQSADRDRAAHMESAEQDRRAAERDWLSANANPRAGPSRSVLNLLATGLAAAALTILAFIGMIAYGAGEELEVRHWLIAPTGAYFLIAIWIVISGARKVQETASHG